MPFWGFSNGTKKKKKKRRRKEQEEKKFQIPLRTPQRTQPAFNPNRVFVQLTFCCQECTHFVWPSLLVQLFSHNVIRSVAFYCY